MTDALFIAGLGIACFVAYYIGGANTGPAFGPAVDVLEQADDVDEDLVAELRERIGEGPRA